MQTSQNRKLQQSGANTVTAGKHGLTVSFFCCRQLCHEGTVLQNLAGLSQPRNSLPIQSRDSLPSRAQLVPCLIQVNEVHSLIPYGRVSQTVMPANVQTHTAWQEKIK
jgi:hypothetical protein